jgi:acyl carrier protein
MAEVAVKTMPLEGILEGMSFEQFRNLLVEVLAVSEEKVTPEASFITDLAVDSIRMVEMVLAIEELGVKIPPEAAWQIQTVADAYNYYLEHVAAQA